MNFFLPYPYHFRVYIQKEGGVNTLFPSIIHVPGYNRRKWIQAAKTTKIVILLKPPNPKSNFVLSLRLCIWTLQLVLNKIADILPRHNTSSQENISRLYLPSNIFINISICSVKWYLIVQYLKIFKIFKNLIIFYIFLIIIWFLIQLSQLIIVKSPAIFLMI